MVSVLLALSTQCHRPTIAKVQVLGEDV